MRLLFTSVGDWVGWLLTRRCECLPTKTLRRRRLVRPRSWSSCIGTPDGSSKDGGYVLRIYLTVGMAVPPNMVSIDGIHWTAVLPPPIA